MPDILPKDVRLQIFAHAHFLGTILSINFKPRLKIVAFHGVMRNAWPVSAAKWQFGGLLRDPPMSMSQRVSGKDLKIDAADFAYFAANGVTDANKSGELRPNYFTLDIGGFGHSNLEFFRLTA